MKTKRRYTALAAAMAVSVGVVMSGCASSALDRRERVVSSMEDTRNYVTRSRTQVAATMTALNGLPDKSGDALVAQYRQFVREFGQLESLANDLGRQAATVRERGNQQLKAWQEEAATLQDAELRRRAEERRAEQAARYETFAKSIADTERDLHAFLTDLRDIRRYLDADLTPQGVAATRDKIAEANRDMNPVMQSLDRLNEGVTMLAERVAPGGAPATGASGGGTASGGSTATGSSAGGAGTSAPSRQGQ